MEHTDKRTDAVPFHRPCAAYYADSANNVLWIINDLFIKMCDYAPYFVLAILLHDITFSPCDDFWQLGVECLVFLYSHPVYILHASALYSCTNLSLSLTRNLVLIPMHAYACDRSAFWRSLKTSSFRLTRATRKASPWRRRSTRTS